MGLPDGSVGRVLLGGIGFVPLCSPDLVCLVLLVGLLCVGAEGVFFFRHVDLVVPRRGPFLGRGFSRCCVVYALDAWVRVGRISLGPLVSYAGGSLPGRPDNSVAWIPGA